MARKTKIAVAATALADSTSSKNAKPRQRRAPKSRLTLVPDAKAAAVGPIIDGSAKQITGKLGVVAQAVAAPDGAMLEELTAATGWQRHTVRAALTRLRQRGIDARLTTVGDRKAYRVTPAVA